MQTLKGILREHPEWVAQTGNIQGTDKGDTWHNYIDEFYEREMDKYRGKNPIIIEVGVLSGKSLLLWDEYFANHHGVWGLDISFDSVCGEVHENPRIHLVGGNAYTTEIANLIPDADIIIDDGPHTIGSMVSFIRIYLSKLKPGGVMVIEDIQDYSWFSILEQEVPSEGFSSERIDLRGRRPSSLPDDMMFCVRR
jgi:cephalosporin hydroxylase